MPGCVRGERIARSGCIIFENLACVCEYIGASAILCFPYTPYAVLASDFERAIGKMIWKYGYLYRDLYAGNFALCYLQSYCKSSFTPLP